MSLRRDQAHFTIMVGQLISYGTSFGLLMRMGDAWRSTDPLKCPSCAMPHSYQQLLVFNKRSQTLLSKHADRLAIDFIVEPATGGEMESDDWEQLGRHWELLGGQWGGRWKARDLGHFQYEAPPPPKVIVA